MGITASRVARVSTVEDEPQEHAGVEEGWSRANIGLFLAVLAAMFEYGATVWPMTPRDLTQASPLWVFGAVISATAFLLAAFLADHWTGISKVLLFVFGLVLIASGLISGKVSAGGPISAIVDLIPGVLALIAGVLIGRVRRHALP